MLNKIHQEHLFNCCNILHNSIEQDVIVTDQNGEPIIEFIQSSSPKFVEEFIRGDHISIVNQLVKNEPNHILYYSTTREFSYIGIGVFSDDKLIGSVILGPFIQKSLNQVWIEEIIRIHYLDPTVIIPLKNFYKTLSVYNIEQMRSIGSLMLNIISHDLIDANTIYNENGNIPRSVEKIEQTIDDFNYIEKSFQLESELINAVKKGNLELALKIKSSSHLMLNIENYVSNDSLQSAKWLLFSANVVYTRAIIEGGVHPVTADSLSRKFSKLINKASTIKELMPLSNKILVDYCNSVKIARSSEYSQIIAKAITFIKLNMSERISLRDVSSYLHISSSYLSTAFKKETNMTISQFIQQERVNEAISLFKQHTSMTDVAAMVGYDDPNYFCRIFKKITGLSPTEYLKKNK